MFLSFFLQLTGTFSVYGQKDSSSTENPYKLNGPYLKSYWYDTRSIAISPAFWSSKELVAFAGITTGSLIAYTRDEQIQDIFQKNRSHGGDQVTRYVLEPLGSGLYTIPLMGVFYLEGLLVKNDRSKKTALLGIKTIVLTAAYSRIPKYVFQRHRPYQNNPGQPYSWEGPFHGITDFTSFPSGHAVSAFALAAVISSEYADHWAVPLVCYSLASAASLSRIYDNKHWASDVLVGAVFGYAMGKLIYNKDSWLNGSGKKKPARENKY